MAENQQNGAQRFLSWLNPVNRVRDMASGWRDHPVQSGISAGLGLVPVAGPGLSALSRMLFSNRNNRETNDQLESMIGTQNQNLSDQIWSQWQPQDSRPGSTTGGMPGITGSYQPRQPAQTAQNGQGPLLQMLGIQGYGSSPQGPGQGPQGYAGGHNTYTGQAGSNFVGPGQSENTAGYGPSSTYSGQSGASSSLGGNGATVGYATMSGIENMLSAGIGNGGPYQSATQRREMSSDRASMRQAGFEKLPGETPQAYRARAQQAGII